MIGVGIIGYGYWGPNLVRNFSEIPHCRVVAVSDLLPDRLTKLQVRAPQVRVTTDYRDLLTAPDIDALVIATPVSTHFPLAVEALRSGKHVMVEKPLASSTAEAEVLVNEAIRGSLTLMVDHTFIYTGAVRKIREIIAANRLGRIMYYDSVRVNLGVFQRDVSVLWDLAVHDLSIMDYVLQEQPAAVSAVGAAHVMGQPMSMAYLTCHFNSGVLAHFHVNWLAPVKIRRTLIGGEKEMIVYDDLEPSEKVKVYDRGITLDAGDDTGDSAYQLRVGYRSGDMWAPKVSLAEGLHVEALHFIECIEYSKTPLTDGRAGLRAVQMLEAATKSLESGGRAVPIAQGRAF